KERSSSMTNYPPAKRSGSKGRSSPSRPTAPEVRALHPPDPNRQAEDVDSTLSPEECRIIALIVAGYTNRDMARKLSLSESTINRRIAGIIGKLGVANRFELMLFAIKHRIFKRAPKD